MILKNRIFSFLFLASVFFIIVVSAKEEGSSWWSRIWNKRRQKNDNDNDKNVMNINLSSIQPLLLLKDKDDGEEEKIYLKKWFDERCSRFIHDDQANDEIVVLYATSGAITTDGNGNGNGNGHGNGHGHHDDGNNFEFYGNELQRITSGLCHLLNHDMKEFYEIMYPFSIIKFHHDKKKNDERIIELHMSSSSTPKKKNNNNNNNNNDDENGKKSHSPYDDHYNRWSSLCLTNQENGFNNMENVQCLYSIYKGLIANMKHEMMKHDFYEIVVNTTDLVVSDDAFSGASLLLEEEEEEEGNDHDEDEDFSQPILRSSPFVPVVAHTTTTAVQASSSSVRLFGLGSHKNVIKAKAMVYSNPTTKSALSSSISSSSVSASSFSPIMSGGNNNNKGGGIMEMKTSTRTRAASDRLFTTSTRGRAVIVNAYKPGDEYMDNNKKTHDNFLKKMKSLKKNDDDNRWSQLIIDLVSPSDNQNANDFFYENEKENEDRNELYFSLGPENDKAKNEKKENVVEKLYIEMIGTFDNKWKRNQLRAMIVSDKKLKSEEELMKAMNNDGNGDGDETKIPSYTVRYAEDITDDIEIISDTDDANSEVYYILESICKEVEDNPFDALRSPDKLTSKKSFCTYGIFEIKPNLDQRKMNEMDQDIPEILVTRYQVPVGYTPGYGKKKKAVTVESDVISDTTTESSTETVEEEIQKIKSTDLQPVSDYESVIFIYPMALNFFYLRSSGQTIKPCMNKKSKYPFGTDQLWVREDIITTGSSTDDVEDSDNKDNNQKQPGYILDLTKWERSSMLGSNQDWESVYKATVDLYRVEDNMIVTEGVNIAVPEYINDIVSSSVKDEEKEEKEEIAADSLDDEKEMGASGDELPPSEAFNKAEAETEKNNDEEEEEDSDSDKKKTSKKYRENSEKALQNLKENFSNYFKSSINDLSIYDKDVIFEAPPVRFPVQGVENYEFVFRTLRVQTELTFKEFDIIIDEIVNDYDERNITIKWHLDGSFYPSLLDMVPEFKDKTRKALNTEGTSEFILNEDGYITKHIFRNKLVNVMRLGPLLSYLNLRDLSLKSPEERSKEFQNIAENLKEQKAEKYENIPCKSESGLPHFEKDEKSKNPKCNKKDHNMNQQKKQQQQNQTTSFKVDFDLDKAIKLDMNVDVNPKAIEEIIEQLIPKSVDDVTNSVEVLSEKFDEIGAILRDGIKAEEGDDAHNIAEELKQQFEDFPFWWREAFTESYDASTGRKTKYFEGKAAFSGLGGMSKTTKKNEEEEEEKTEVEKTEAEAVEAEEESVETETETETETVETETKTETVETETGETETGETETSETDDKNTKPNKSFDGKANDEDITSTSRRLLDTTSGNVKEKEEEEETYNGADIVHFFYKLYGAPYSATVMQNPKTNSISLHIFASLPSIDNFISGKDKIIGNTTMTSTVNQRKPTITNIKKTTNLRLINNMNNHRSLIRTTPTINGGGTGFANLMPIGPEQYLGLMDKTAMTLQSSGITSLNHLLLRILKATNLHGRPQIGCSLEIPLDIDNNNNNNNLMNICDNHEQVMKRWTAA